MESMAAPQLVIFGALSFSKAYGVITPKQFPLDQLSRLAVHHDQAINRLVQKHWGNIGPGTSEEKLATMRRFNNDLRATSGNHIPGKALFMKHCGICHRLHGEGNQIGPDLTSANRNDRAALLGNIVDPSAGSVCVFRVKAVRTP
jgi:hypothetical protein